MKKYVIVKDIERLKTRLENIENDIATTDSYSYSNPQHAIASLTRRVRKLEQFQAECEQRFKLATFSHFGVCNLRKTTKLQAQFELIIKKFYDEGRKTFSRRDLRFSVDFLNKDNLALLQKSRRSSDLQILKRRLSKTKYAFDLVNKEKRTIQNPLYKFITPSAEGEV